MNSESESRRIQLILGTDNAAHAFKEIKTREDGVLSVPGSRSKVSVPLDRLSKVVEALLVRGIRVSVTTI